ncbi:MAG: epoxyqueuosine reductase QueH [Clostridiales Family XIII bacterium]|nr:epoxyqueuosine reductase QueH [Clostridiales Family XIII bacterium]
MPSDPASKFNNLSAAVPPEEARRYSLSDYGEEREERPALLLHTCCGPCSTAVVERLAERYRITLYFCNSNIDDEEEYRRRLAAQRAFVAAYNGTDAGLASPLALVVAPYAPEAFLASVAGQEDAPEGGARCRICIAGRLEATAAHAAMNGFSVFSTTLSVSPHKDFEGILWLGREIAVRYGLTFLGEDFKARGGFARSVELSKQYGLYRQNFCGCRFSRRDAEARGGRGERAR